MGPEINPSWFSSIQQLVAVRVRLTVNFSSWETFPNPHRRFVLIGSGLEFIVSSRFELKEFPVLQGFGLPDRLE